MKRPPNLRQNFTTAETKFYELDPLRPKVLQIKPTFTQHFTN